MNIQKMSVPLLLAFSMLGAACDSSLPEYERLGFIDANEMREIHSKGWHTKQRYQADIAKQQGFDSWEALIAKEKADLERQRIETEKIEAEKKINAERQRLAAVQAEKDNQLYGKTASDLGLFCDSDHPYDHQGKLDFVLVYSKRLEIQRIGEFDEGRNWKPVDFIEKVSENNITIKFDITNLVSQALGTKKQPGDENTFSIDRASLKGTKYSYYSFSGGNNYYYTCRTLSDEEFRVYAKQMLTARAERQKSNKI